MESEDASINLIEKSIIKDAMTNMMKTENKQTRNFSFQQTKRRTF